MPLREQCYYRYAPLQPGSIRLLELHPQNDELIQATLIQASVDQAEGRSTPFLALSYTWGDPRTSRRWIKLDGKRFHIQPNLLDALEAIQAIFAEKPCLAKPIWIDAICVDQNNLPERNAEVARMHLIYSGAERVLAWLGKESYDSEFAMFIIGSLANGAVKDIAKPVSEGLTTPLKNLCQRDYWYRAWTQQEIALGKERTILLCGKATLPFASLARAYGRLRSLGWHGLTSTGAVFALQNVKGFSMEELITAAHSTWRCSDKRDIVFSLLSMASETIDRHIY